MEILLLQDPPPHEHVADHRFIFPLVELRVGAALETLPTLASERRGPFDFIFIDADKTNYDNYFEAVLPKLADRGIIAIDNTLWGGRVLGDADQSDDTVAIRKLNDKLAADDRVTCVQLTIRDGVTLIRRRL